MILHFELYYTSDNDFFEFLLKFYAQEYKFELCKENERYDLFVRGEEVELKAFLELFNIMPHSIFLKHFDVKMSEKEILKPSKFEPQNYEKRDFLTQLNANFYTQKKEFIPNEWGEFVNSTLSFDKKEFEKITPQNIQILLEKAQNALTQSKSIFLKNHLGTYKFALFQNKFEADFLMPCDMKAIRSVFVCNDEQLSLLASLEKPLSKLRINAPLRKELGLSFNEFKIKLADNLFLFALGQALFANSYHFLAVKKLENLSDDFECFSLNERLVVVRGLDFINQRARKLILSKTDKNMAKISYIISQYQNHQLLFELGKKNEDLFILQKELNLLKLHLPKNAKSLYDDIVKDETGEKLLANFSKNFPLLQGEFDLCNNFYSLLGLVGLVLNLHSEAKEAAETLLSLSDESKMPRGVKIDFRFKENENKNLKTSKEFDYTRTLRSVMSFLLAGVDSTNIAYGAVESLAFFLRDFYDELSQNHQAEVAILSGELFAHKSLLKNSLKHIKNSQISNVPFSV